MFNRITNDFRFVPIYYQLNPPQKLLSVETVAVGRQFKDIIICKMIVMSHYLNTISLSESERGKKQNSEEYKKKLTDEVIKMLSIERLATIDYSDTSFEAYLPIIYYVSALNSYLGNKYDEIINAADKKNPSLNTDFNYKMLYKFIMRVKACISMADLRTTDELMVIYRTTIELFMTYIALWDENDGVIETYYKFDEAALNYNYDGVIPDEMLLRAKDSESNKVQYINYGWIQYLKEYKTISSKKPSFSISGLSKIIDKKYAHFDPNFGSSLYKFYKSCNPQTHGTLVLMNYFQLEMHIFQNIAVMLKFVCDVILGNYINLDYKIGVVYLIEELEKAIKLTDKTSIWLDSDNNNLYKTNLDYRSRAFCVLKMKEYM